MHIDLFTVLLFGFFVSALLGVLFLAFWINDRRSTWFAWWGAAFFLSALVVPLTAPRGIISDFITIGLANAVMLVGLGCAWQAARAFEKRRPKTVSLIIPPAVWLVACLVPTFIESVAARILLASVLTAPLKLLVAYEYWRGRAERLLSRWPLIVLFASFAFLDGIRIPAVAFLPFPFGALPMQAGWFAAYNLAVVLHVIVLTVLVVSMTKERLELQQRTIAQTDPLTGALNRRAFMWRGLRLLRRHQRDNQPAALLFFDLDRFKALNDRYGHGAGDTVLLRFVAVVQNNMRPGDFLFRLGGEEFCSLLSHTNAAQGHRVAERIREQFEALTVVTSGGSIKATVSIGVACSDSFGHDLEVLTRRADDAVYAAKRQGRNRAVIAEPDERVARTPLPTRNAPDSDFAAAG